MSSNLYKDKYWVDKMGVTHMVCLKNSFKENILPPKYPADIKKYSTHLKNGYNIICSELPFNIKGVGE